MNNKDADVIDIVRDFPVLPKTFAEQYTLLRGMSCNAKVVVNPNGRTLEIFPEEGGYLAAEIEHLIGDIAPWSD